MATIGLDNIVYSKITEGENGDETYAEPKKLAKALTADLSITLAEAILYADDGPAESVKEFANGTLSLGIDDLKSEVIKDLTGAEIDKNGVVISTSEDTPGPVAIGFRSRKANGKYRYFWFYKVQFGIPGLSLKTKGESIEFQTHTIEGTVMRRNKVDTKGKHLWKSEVTEGESEKSAETIKSWFTQVYEPEYDEAV